MSASVGRQPAGTQRGRPASRDTAAPAKPVSERLIISVLSLGLLGFSLLQSLVVPVLPTLQRGLHTSPTAVTWVITAYLLSASVFTPIMGRLGDAYGKRRLFAVAMMALSVGAALSGLAHSLPLMLVGRVVQGMGGGVLPLSFGIVRDEFEADHVSTAIGRLAAMTAATVGIGLVLSGPIESTLDYHWLFWFPVIICALAGVASRVSMRETPTQQGNRVNWWAAFLLSAWLVALLVAASQAPVWGWTSAAVLVLLVVAVVGIVAWIVVESRAASPLIDMALMRMRAVWSANLVALVSGVGLYAMFSFVPQFVQTSPSAGYGFGVSTTLAGLMMLPMSAAMFVMGQLSGRLARVFGARNLILVGSLLGCAAFAFLALDHQARWTIYVATGVLGIGFGIVFAAMSAVVVAAVPASQTGAAGGMNTNIRTIGGSLGVAVMASIVDAHVGPHGLPSESGYTSGFWMIAGAMLLSAGAAMIIPARRRRAERVRSLVPTRGLRQSGPGDAP